MVSMETMVHFLLFSIGFNLLLFSIAYYLQTDKITDLGYSLTFVSIAIYSFFHSEKSLLDIILLFLVSLWAIRLGGYLLYRIQFKGRDQRFDKIRIKFSSFLLFWVMQAITCFLVMIPIIQINSVIPKEVNSLFILGVIVSFFGWMIESIADHQKFTFKKAHPNRPMQNGLWSYVQHPNYSGELLFWWGIFMACITYTSFWTIVSPIWISFIIIGFSGIPILQKSWKTKYENNPSFREYQKRTKKLIPFLY